MKLVLVDDEALAVRNLKKKLMNLHAESEIADFTKPEEALCYAKSNEVEIAFLDVELPGMNGLVLAKRLKDIQPDIRIIFVTGFDKYAVDAFALHASGYLIKPAKPQAIERELTFAYDALVKKKKGKPIRVQTFGGFEVFINDVPLVFKRSKSKELLAFLVNQQGASITTREASAILWEDKEYSSSQQSYFQTIVADLLTTLKNAGAEEIVIKKRNSLAIAQERIDCDYYNFQKGDIHAVNAYAGNYMPSYSWAEFTVGYLERIFEAKG